MTRDRHVLILTPYAYGTAPGPRSSIELWEQVLASDGIHFHYAPFETAELREVIYRPGRIADKASALMKAYIRQVRSLGSLGDYDGVLVYREAALVGPALLERWAARRKPIIYQLDDPLYVPYKSPFSGWFSYLKFFGKVGSICRLSKVTIVNSRQHEEYARRYAANVVQIPSVVDGDEYTPKQSSSKNGPVRIGWTGSASTVSNLRVIARPLREVAQRPDAHLHCIGPSEPPVDGVPCTYSPWSAESEVENIRQFDVGLLPLPVNEWTKRKFYLKLVQYMAVGVPPVCTPLGSALDVVEHGVTGFHAHGDREWVEHLERLVEDRAMREQMGQVAAERAHARFTLQANADRITAAFRSALA